MAPLAVVEEIGGFAREGGEGVFLCVVEEEEEDQNQGVFLVD